MQALQIDRCIFHILNLVSNNYVALARARNAVLRFNFANLFNRNLNGDIPSITTCMQHADTKSLPRERSNRTAL